MYEAQLEDNRGIPYKGKEKHFPKQIEQDAKFTIIMREIAAGTTYYALVEKLCNEWGLSKSTVKGCITDAIRFMRDEETKEKVNNPYNPVIRVYKGKHLYIKGY